MPLVNQQAALSGSRFSFYGAGLPTFDIGEGALDKVFAIYKGLLPSLGGYLTEAGTLNKQRFQLLLAKIAELELSVLEERAAV